MSVSSDQNEFWDRVEHKLKVSQPGTWRATTWMLRLGMVLVLLPCAYFLFFSILTPAKGYFISSVEMAVHPVFWLLVGTIFIIAGAYLRFRAMGPIVEKLKTHGLD